MYFTINNVQQRRKCIKIACRTNKTSIMQIKKLACFLYGAYHTYTLHIHNTIYNNDKINDDENYKR